MASRKRPIRGALAVSSAGAHLPMRVVATRSGLLGAGAAFGGSMNDHDRLEQLRVLLVRLEQMPASAQRDWMLGEVRARAVDVETGAEPTAMRALSEDGAELEAARVEAAQPVPPPK